MSLHKIPSRRRLTGAALATGLGGSFALALSMGASLSGLTATINNTTNTAESATLAVSETSGAATCNSYDATATCATINKYGGVASPLSPGQSQTVTVNFQSKGTAAVGSSTLTASACTATATAATGSTTPTTPNTTSGNLCSVLNIKIYKSADTTGTVLYDGSAAALGTTAPIALGAIAKNATQPFTFVVSLPASATTATQGQQVSQPLLWTYNQ